MLLKRDPFVRALKTLVTLVPKRSTIPILENIIIVPTKEGVALTATDLTTEARVIVPANDALVACLPARKLLEFVSSADRGAPIEMSREGSMVRVMSASASIELPDRSVADFPKSMGCDGKTIDVADPTTFVESLAWVARAVGHDVTRPQLIGVLFDEDRLVATDGHRLHRGTIKGLGCPRALVPASTVAFVLRAMKNAESIQITVSDATVRFVSTTWTITTSMVNAIYPAYEQIIPKPGGAAFTMKVGARELGAGLKRASGRGGDEPLTLRANGAIKLETCVDGVQRAATVSVLETTHEGLDHVQGFNGRYFYDALGDDDATATLRFYDPESPVVVNAGDRTAVVMPCRL